MLPMLANIVSMGNYQKFALVYAGFLKIDFTVTFTDLEVSLYP